MRGHEVDGFRGDLLRRNRQIALVFAILIVDHDHHLAASNSVDGVVDRRKG